MLRRHKGQKRKKFREKEWEEPEYLEEQWKGNFWNVKPVGYGLNRDTDQDGVPDSEDCDPYNPNKQDLPTRPTVTRPPSIILPTITRETARPREQYLSAPLGQERARSSASYPRPTPPLPVTIPPMTPIRTSRIVPQPTSRVPVNLPERVSSALSLPTPRSKPTSAEIQKLVAEARDLHNLPYLPKNYTGVPLTLVTKFGEQYWANSSGIIVFRAS